MDPIVVPAPPKSAFNKNRRVSDLLLAQLKHFQHVAHKQGMRTQIDPALEREIGTEAGAARYIAAITRQILAQGRPSGIALVPPAPAAHPAEPGIIEDLAAASESPAQPCSPRKTKKPKKETKAGS